MAMSRLAAIVTAIALVAPGDAVSHSRRASRISAHALRKDERGIFDFERVSDVAAPNEDFSANTLSPDRPSLSTLEKDAVLVEADNLTPDMSMPTLATDQQPSAPQQVKGNGFWALVHLGSIPDDASSLGASVDDKGGITLTADGDADSSKFVAHGVWQDTLPQVGWSSLSMHISDSVGDVDDGVKMYAAGVVEGYLTAGRIREFHKNSRALVEMNPSNHDRLPKLKDALHNMVERLADGAERESSPANTAEGQARLAFLQTWGVRDGYALAVQNSPTLQQHDAHELSMVEMFILNSDGVIDELLTAYGGEPQDEMLLQKSRKHRALRGSNKARRFTPAGHCTGVVRLTDDKSEIFFGHTTWEAFSEMTRIWKVYDFPLKGASAKKISFSSYPGCVSSTDDYYLMDSGLAITETTLSIPSKQQYSTQASMPDFIRIMATNRIATDAPSWAQSMIDTATGTYSSQWMILDYKKFTPGQDLQPGTFEVLEQVPGVNHMEDMSSWLQKEGYWASYDRAFFDDSRAQTGDETMLHRVRGPEAELYSKQGTPRGQIVRSTAKDIVSLDAMRTEMTRNLGTHEPVDEPALQIPRYAISARDDLEDDQRNNPDGGPDGGVDAKITSSCLFKTLTAQAISSPSHTSLPAFKWQAQNGMEIWPGFPHEGLPNEANFDWQRIDPQDQMISPVDNGGCQ